MPKQLLILAAAALLTGAVFAAPDSPSTQPSTAPASQPAPMTMERWSMVILMSPDSPTKMSNDETMEIQKQHLAHLGEMHRQGKMVAAGPFGDQYDKKMRGMCLYRTSLEEAKACAESDPAVKAGRLRVEVLSWYALKGSIEFRMARATQENK